MEVSPSHSVVTLLPSRFRGQFSSFGQGFVLSAHWPPVMTFVLCFHWLCACLNQASGPTDGQGLDVVTTHCIYVTLAPLLPPGRAS